MTWRPFRQDPSLISRKENALASRRVRTQPWSRIPSIGEAAFRAWLTSVRCMRRNFCSRSQLLQAVANLEKRTQLSHACCGQADCIPMAAQGMNFP